MNNRTYDVIIIGSGFGGSMTAWQLVKAGLKVLMIERGDWVPRGEHNWGAQGSVYLTPFYSQETPYRMATGKNKFGIGSYNCVGGPSVFYGGVSLRLREKDFAPAQDSSGDSGVGWAINYADLEPYYTHAEQILNVAGEENSDLTEPYHSAPYPQRLPTLAPTPQKIGNAARKLGLHPFRLPLAINYSDNGKQPSCIECTTCDTFACAVEAKNDLATRVIPQLLKEGMQLKENTVAVKFITEETRITAIECVDRKQNQKIRYNGRLFILSAGALASPHLLLTSRLEKFNSAGRVVGRYLMRHCNAIVFGLFPFQPAKDNRFHKQLGFHDFYFGHPSIKHPSGKLGSIQQVQTPPVSLVKAMLPKPLGEAASIVIKHLTGMLVMAEDQPRYDNHVAVDFSHRDRFGLPQLVISHHYSERDFAARKALLKKAKQILYKTGALFCYVHDIKTFSHAVGTVRMGNDPNTSPLDAQCRFRGIQNLYVVDGSFMPTSGGVNPSLTISANALRVGEYLTKNFNRIT